MLLVYIIKLLAIYLLGFFYFIVAVAVHPFNKERSLTIFQSFLYLVFKTFDVKISFEFDDPQTQFSKNAILVVLNQSSFLDALVCPLIPVKPLKGIINIEFALYPVVGWFTSLISFTIVRQWSRQAKRTLNRASAYLQGGGNLLISIEGKRSHDGKINQYKKGPIVTAIQNQSLLLPIIIYGARSSLPFGSLRIKPGTLRLRFLKPLPTNGLTYEDRDVLRERLITMAKQEGLVFKE